MSFDSFTKPPKPWTIDTPEERKTVTVVFHGVSTDVLVTATDERDPVFSHGIYEPGGSGVKERISANDGTGRYIELTPEPSRNQIVYNPLPSEDGGTGSWTAYDSGTFEGGE